MTSAKATTQAPFARKASRKLPALLSFCALLVGCATETERTPLPAYLSISDRDALQIIATRQSAIKTVSARCDIVLTDPQGQTVNLDGALLAMPATASGPKVRLRAWKLGQAVFDITLTDGEAWLIAPDNPRINNPDNTSGQAQTARRIAETLDFIGPSFFQSAKIVSTTPTTITASSAYTNLTRILCVIDRATLTPQRFTAGGTAIKAAATSELLLLDYRIIGTIPSLPSSLPMPSSLSIPWAHRLQLTSPGGSVIVEMSEVEINAELPPSAFVPPTRARRLP